MTLNTTIYFITAMAFGAFAWLLWWRAMPPLLVKRGRLQALAPWLLGMAMALFVTNRLELAMLDAPVRWTPAFGDLCLILASIAELARTHAIGRFRWGKCPQETEAAR